MKGAMLGATNAAGELYVVQTRHCIHTRMPVYKVGRAQDAGRRLQQYPKGSRLVVRLPVSHMKDSEGMLLALCRTNFVQRRDFGTEYFEGNICKVVGLLATVAQLYPLGDLLPPVTLEDTNMNVRISSDGLFNACEGAGVIEAKNLGDLT